MIAHDRKFALTPNLPQRFVRGCGRNRLAGAEDPDSLFCMQSGSSPSRPEHDAIFRALQFQRITRAKLHFVADRLGENYAAGFVEG